MRSRPRAEQGTDQACPFGSAQGRPEPAERERARARCLRLLAVRARSAAELRQRLSSGGFGKEVVDEVLSDLEQAGLVDDEEFARSWVSARRRAGGKARLRWELRRKGVSADLIRQVVDEGIDDESEVEAALEVARKKLEGRPGAAGRPGPQERARLQRLLRGRGFEYEVVEQVMRRVAAEGEG